MDYVLDQALRGESVEIIYKGARLRLTPLQGGSKLARAVRRPTLRVDPQSIVESDADLMRELNKGWRRDELRRAICSCG